METEAEVTAPADVDRPGADSLSHLVKQASLSAGDK